MKRFSIDVLRKCELARYLKYDKHSLQEYMSCRWYISRQMSPEMKKVVAG